MTCPKDKTELKQITKDDVVIDFCPTCRGVWLDRGELDKIIERSILDYDESDSTVKTGSEEDYPDLNKAGSFKTRRPYRTGSNYLGALFDLDEPGVEGNRGFLGSKR